jgi:hypothetical protein
MSAANTKASLDGWFKEMYADKADKLVPSVMELIKLPFEPKGKDNAGDHYNRTITLTNEHGVTVAEPSAGAFALVQPVAMVTKKAQAEGNQFLLRSQIDYEAAARAASSKAAFGDIVSTIVEVMTESMAKRREISYLYGRSAKAVAASGSTSTFVVTAASWAATMWAGMEGAAVNIVRGTLGLYTNVVGSGSDASGVTGIARNSLCAKIASVNPATRTITVSLAGGGVIANAVAAGDELYFGGEVTGALGANLEGVGGTAVALSYREMLGLDGVCTASTSLYGVDISTYNLFKANTYSAGSAAMNVTKFLNAKISAVGKGAAGDSVCLTSYSTLVSLMAPIVDPGAVSSSNAKIGLQMTKEQGQELSLGARSVKIAGPSGTIELRSHLYVKDGEAFDFPKDALQRIGATDVTFNTPGSKPDEFFLQLQDTAAFELRCYSNEGLFVRRPGRLTKITGIVN